ncbi:MAG: putative LPS assembly protein LptD [Flavobacteriales bacterium Tduv]
MTAQIAKILNPLIKKTERHTFLFFFILLHGLICAHQASESPVIPKDQEDVFQKKEEILKEPIKYNADVQDHDLEHKKTYLIGNASIDYTDIKIQADYIEIDWKTNEIYTRCKIDSTGKTYGTTKFIQGEKKYEYSSFRFNFKTKKGIAENLRTEEQDGVIIAKKIKRKSDSINLMRDALYTTDPYFKEKKDTSPDYYLKTNKIKHIDKHSIITGPILMYIYKIPMPLFFPFSYIPLADKNNAGILIPRWGERADSGFFLENFGFFWPISDYSNSKIMSSVYTNGSWRIDTQAEYKLRYKYSGHLAFNYQNIITGTKGLRDYNKSNNFELSWSHIQDIKASPSLFFSANVNYASNKIYYRNTLSTKNISNGSVFTNTSLSSISLRKSFEEFPISITLSGDLSQNFNTEMMNMTLPNLTLTMQQRTPFQRKRNTLLRNFTIDYNMGAHSTVNTTTSQLFKKKMFDQMKAGTEQHLSLSTKTDVFTYFRLVSNLGYNEYWVLQSIEKSYDLRQDKVIEITKRGFKPFRTFDIGAEFSFTLYGMKKFKEGSLIQAIRHKIEPTIYYSYTRDFSTAFLGYYKDYIDSHNQYKTYSIFENGLYSSPSTGISQRVDFSLGNNLEMKIRDKNDSIETRKIKLIETFNISTSYDMTKDVFRWNDITFNGSTTIIKNIKINIKGRLYPYKICIDNTDPILFKNHLIDRWGKFTQRSLWSFLDYSIDNNTFKKENQNKKNYKKKGEIRYEKFYFDDDNYARYEIPWNFNLGISYNYSKDLLGKTETSVSLKMDGSISPTPHWKIGVKAYYDLVNRKITNALINFDRDLRSFNMSFLWGPVGGYSFWYFSIGIKAPILKDLKYEKRNSEDYKNSVFK